MKAFLERLVKHVVSNPQDVRIEQIIGERSVVFELHVQEGDMGKVIGRNGQMANALRTILAVASAKHKKKYFLEIIEIKKQAKRSLNPENTTKQIVDGDLLHRKNL